MKGRIVFREGDAANEPADAVVAGPDGPVDEESLRAAMRRGLADARARGLRTVAVPALGAGALPLQRCAEILLEEARQHLAGETSLTEIRFVLFGEPAYRVFEMVNDAAKVAAQMERLRARPTGR